MFPADQRFQKDPGNVTVEEGKLFNLTVCYLKHLPESVNLSTITLVEEATGNTVIANLDRTNYCALFPLQDPQPGTYHFKVAVHYGNIISRSFHIGMWYVLLHIRTHARTQSHRHRNTHIHAHTHTHMRSNTVIHTCTVLYMHAHTHTMSTPVSFYLTVFVNFTLQVWCSLP